MIVRIEIKFVNDFERCFYVKWFQLAHGLRREGYIEEGHSRERNILDVFPLVDINC